MPESSLRPEPVDCFGEEVGAQVKRADDKRGRSEESSSVGVQPRVSRRAGQWCQNPGRVAPRICVRMDCEDARVLGVRIPQPTGSLDERPSRFGSGIGPPGAQSDQPEEVDVELTVCGCAGLLCCGYQ